VLDSSRLVTTAEGRLDSPIRGRWDGYETGVVGLTVAAPINSARVGSSAGTPCSEIRRARVRLLVMFIGLRAYPASFTVSR
jgi:hypothetical protein